MDTSPLKPGDLVWYRGIYRGQEFKGVVDSEPWMIGGHTEVVRLRAMDGDYVLIHHRDNVPCAATRRIRRRELR